MSTSYLRGLHSVSTASTIVPVIQQRTPIHSQRLWTQFRYVRSSQIRAASTEPTASTIPNEAKITTGPNDLTELTSSNILPVSMPAEGKSFATGLAVASALFVASLGVLYVTDTRASVHRYILPPLLRGIFPDAEDSHHYSIAMSKAAYDMGLHPRERQTFPQEQLGIEVFGHNLASPIGISAGLDKNAEIPDALFALGPAVVEVGGITPLPQDGNPQPRCFRVPTLDGIVNRYGLNSKGADVIAIRLRDRLRKFARISGLTEEQVQNGEAGVPPGSLQPGKLLCVQIAKNKATDETDLVAVAKDYVYCVRRLAPYADVLVVNVSSPNTPGLRSLQAVEPLSRILGAVVKEAQATDRKEKPKVMVKVSPDEDEEAQMNGIVQAVWMSGVDGVIVGNTTKRRSGLVPPNLQLTPQEKLALGETGGFSGPQLFEKTLELTGRYRKMLDEVYKTASSDDPVAGKNANPEQKVIFATGGITNGEQARKIIDAGASLAMVYTGLVYGGPGTVTRMKTEMLESMR